MLKSVYCYECTVSYILNLCCPKITDQYVYIYYAYGVKRSEWQHNIIFYSFPLIARWLNWSKHTCTHVSFSYRYPCQFFPQVWILWDDMFLLRHYIKSYGRSNIRFCTKPIGKYVGLNFVWPNWLYFKSYVETYNEIKSRKIDKIQKNSFFSLSVLRFYGPVNN